MRVPECALAERGSEVGKRKSGRMFPSSNGQRAASIESDSSNGVTSARVPAVLKAFKLLDIISRSDKPLGVSELARRLELGKSTVHGLVTTLESLGVLEAVNGSRRYTLGPRLSALSSRTGIQPDLRQSARDALERLAEATEQTSFLGVPADGHVTILDIVHGRPTLAISAPVGSSIPLLAGAVGKVVLASWDAQKRRDFLSKSALPAFTSASIISPDAYERSVGEAVARGAAIDVDEYVDGVRAAASPVIGPGQKLVAILWVAGFSRHIDSGRLDFIASAVAREAAEISRRLTGT
jgi:IclR family transcriptional regulator, KDG regulon repressor